ncbi:hypothetical protein, partial [Hominenteromicrobium sp.]|uniref:hypothetical protein n=1 Tax=Hominenteromicrobium sp. TaxID=3073581 RepID=UPI003A92B249
HGAVAQNHGENRSARHHIFFRIAIFFGLFFRSRSGVKSDLQKKPSLTFHEIRVVHLQNASNYCMMKAHRFDLWCTLHKVGL